MDEQQRDALVNLLERYEELIAENQALKALLEEIEQHGPLQHLTWREVLDRLMKTLAREQYAAEFAPILRKIESAFQDAELARRFARIPIKGSLQ